MMYFIPIQQTIIVASFFYSIYCVCIGDYDTSKWILLFNLVVPFNIRTLCGWYMLWFIQVNMSLSYILSMIGITAYFVCSCFYIHSVCAHFVHILNSTKAIAQQMQVQKHPHAYWLDSQNLKGRLSQAIEIHAKIFE